jgi:hypothetical protein
VFAEWLAELTVGVVRRGWSPADLGQVARRQLGEPHLRLIAGLLTDHVARHPADRVDDRWSAELTGLAPRGSDNPIAPDADLVIAVAVAGLLWKLPHIAPVLPPPGSVARPPARREGSGDNRRLARVRALLAKAESTDFPEEAETLSAKAQELISQYALDALVDGIDAADGTQDGNERDERDGVLVRRLWIDPPYLLPKGLLVQGVAQANRCRAVTTPDLGFTTLIGASHDLDAVELLVTSLLVQADAAMLSHGRRTGRRGTSRTASFRRAFLVSYAARIGERLGQIDERTVRTALRSAELVPLLADHERRVDGLRNELFPRTITKATSISNAEGWAAGRTAADLARLDTRSALHRDK